MTHHEPQALDAIALRQNYFKRPDWLLDIALFHEKFDHHYVGLPRALPRDLALFRIKFLQEELDEFHDSVVALASELEKDNPDQLTVNSLLELNLDALVDIMYVTLGTAYLQGFLPVMEEAWRRVQKANMSKVRKSRGNGTEIDSGRNPTFDVVKPADFVPPSHLDLVANNAHTSTFALGVDSENLSCDDNDVA